MFLVSIIYLLNNVVDAIILFRVFSSFFHQKLSLLRMYLIGTAFILIKTGINMQGRAFLNLALGLLLLSMFCVLFNGAKKVKLFIILFYLGIMIMTEPFGIVAFRVTEVFWREPFPYILGLAIIMIIRFVIMELIIIRKKLTINHLLIHELRFLYAVGVLSILSGGIFMTILWYDGTIVEHAMSTVFSVSLLLINFLLFKFLQRYTVVVEKSNQNILLERTAKLKDEYYQQLDNSVAEVRMIKHDLRNRLLVISDFVDDKARDMLAEVIGEIDLTESNIYSENPIFNSILQKKLSEAKKSDIEVQILCDIPEGLIFDPSDMGVMVGNLLDNAIEASIELEISKRMIRIRIYYDTDYLYIEIINNKSSAVNYTLETTKENKENHGMGIKSMRRLVEKYGGNVRLEDAGESFRVELIIRLFPIMTLE